MSSFCAVGTARPLDEADALAEAARWWPALAEARRPCAVARRPWRIGTALVGSIAVSRWAVLAGWPQWVTLTEAHATLSAPPAERDAALAAINRSLLAQGHLHGWRDERYRVTDLVSGETLAHTERAAARFWGTRTWGAHANGYVRGADGQPTALWIARRSLDKATDPGLLDNLIGGGVPSHQQPHEALVREGWEEAGLSAHEMVAVQAGRVLHLQRGLQPPHDTPDGLQREDLHVFDLALPAGRVPENQDGEVLNFTLLPIGDALALAAEGAMTVDAALATLDFADRHRLVEAAAGATAAQALKRALHRLSSEPAGFV